MPPHHEPPNLAAMNERERRERRLQRRRERERAHRDSETAEQREEHLRVRRIRDRARHAAQTVPGTSARPPSTGCVRCWRDLLMYKDGRFAKQPRFRYFALNHGDALPGTAGRSNLRSPAPA